MKLAIVAGGAGRYRVTEEHRLRVRNLRESVKARYAEELAEAGIFRRLILRLRMRAELRREMREIGPSSQAL